MSDHPLANGLSLSSVNDSGIHSLAEASFGGGWGPSPPQGKRKKEKKERKKEKREKKRKKEKKKERRKLNNVKLLNIKCLFFQFFNSQVALKNK